MTDAINNLLDAAQDLTSIRDGLHMLLGVDMIESDLNEDIGKIKEALVELFGVPKLEEFDFLFDDTWMLLEEYFDCDINRVELLDQVNKLKEEYNVS